VLLRNEEQSAEYSSPSGTYSSPSPFDGARSPSVGFEYELFSNSFSFAPMGPAHDVHRKIESCLPSWERAHKLADTYLEHAAWLFRTVSHQQLMDELLPTIYQREPRNLIPDYEDYGSPHALCLLFIIFALGALVDTDQEAFSAEATHYYQLAKAALGLQSVFVRPRLMTIQALNLMSVYNAMSQPDSHNDDEGTSMELSWILIRLCHQLSVSVCLFSPSSTC
jgi:Fungal specific transcription factor domain